MLQQILAAVDFSAAAAAAAARAAHLARVRSCALTLLYAHNEIAWSNLKHVLKKTPLEPPAETAARDLSLLARDLETRYELPTVEVEVTIGRAAAEILKTAVNIRPDLIVLGAQGEGMAKEFGLGGTAAKVARAGVSPLLVVRGEAGRPCNRVITGTDFSECSRRALAHARELFPAAEHTLVHAYSVPYEQRLRLGGDNEETIARYRTLQREEAQRRLQDFIGGLDPGSARGLTARVERGHPVAVLLEHAHLHAADVVAVGKHGGTALDEKLFGSVPQRVLSQAPCDVLLVP